MFSKCLIVQVLIDIERMRTKVYVAKSLKIIVLILIDKRVKHLSTNCKFCIFSLLLKRK